MAAQARRRPLMMDGASGIDHAAKLINPINNRNHTGWQIVRAEIINSDQCSAEDIAACGNTPVLALCRELIKAGFDPDRPLHAYRGDTLSLRVRSIGEGARLTVKERPFGPTFDHWVPFSTPPVSPILQNEIAGAAL